MASQGVHTEESVDLQIYAEYSDPIFAEIYSNEFVFLYANNANKETECASSTIVKRIQSSEESEVDKQPAQIRNKYDNDKSHDGRRPEDDKTRISPILERYQSVEPSSTKEYLTGLNENDELKLIQDSLLLGQLDVKNRPSFDNHTEGENGDVPEDYNQVKSSENFLTFGPSTDKNVLYRSKNLKQDEINSSSHNSKMKTTATISEDINSPKCNYENVFAFKGKEDGYFEELLKIRVQQLNISPHLPESSPDKKKMLSAAVGVPGGTCTKITETNLIQADRRLVEVSDREKVEISEFGEEAPKPLKIPMLEAINAKFGTSGRAKRRKNKKVFVDKNVSNMCTSELSKEEKTAYTSTVSANREKTAMPENRKSTDCKVPEDDVKAAGTCMDNAANGKMSMSVANVLKPKMNSSDVEETKAGPISICKVERKGNDLISSNSANKENTEMKESGAADRKEADTRIFEIKEKADTFTSSATENKTEYIMSTPEEADRKLHDTNLSEAVSVNANNETLKHEYPGRKYFETTDYVQNRGSTKKHTNEKILEIDKKIQENLSMFERTSGEKVQQQQKKSEVFRCDEQHNKCLKTDGVNAYSAGAHSNPEAKLLRRSQHCHNNSTADDFGKDNSSFIPKEKQDDCNSEHFNRITSHVGAEASPDPASLKSDNSDEKSSDFIYGIDITEIEKIPQFESSPHHLSVEHNPELRRNHLANPSDQHQQEKMSCEFYNELNEMIEFMSDTHKIVLDLNDEICDCLKDNFPIKKETFFRQVESDFDNINCRMEILLMANSYISERKTNYLAECPDISIRLIYNTIKIASNTGSSLQLSLKDLMKKLHVIRDSVIVKGAKEIRLKKIITEILRSLDDLCGRILKVDKLRI